MGRNEAKMKKLIRIVIVCLGVLLIYTACYLLLMARHCPSLDRTGRIAFRSCFRWSSSAGRIEGTDIQTYEVTIWNYLLAPADKVYYYFFN